MVQRLFGLPSARRTAVHRIRKHYERRIDLDRLLKFVLPWLVGLGVALVTSTS